MCECVRKQDTNRERLRSTMLERKKMFERERERERDKERERE